MLTYVACASVQAEGMHVDEGWKLTPTKKSVHYPFLHWTSLVG